ncbi:MAG: MlaE family lipid ABC transporter permease subunit [Steroidobacteraceae bacterium]
MLTTELQADTLLLRLSGRWTVQSLADIEQALQSLQLDGIKHLKVDGAALEGVDLSAMWLLHSALRRGEQAGAEISFVNDAPNHFAFLNQLEAAADAPPPETTQVSWLRRVIAGFGRQAVMLGQHALGHLDHFGRIIHTFLRAWRHPHHLRAPSIVRHAYEAGIQALPIVAMIAFFVAVIIAYIGASQLQGFGAGIYTVDLITVGVLRELGVLLTAVIVAGRSGSAFAAEIGVMQLNDEVDALKSIGMDPIEVLVMPRVLGLIIALPLLTVVADAMGMAGGALLSNWLLDISLPQFIARVQDALAPTTFWAGLIKAPVFALLIGMIGTYRGMQVRGSSRELGRLTTTAVVESIFMVIFANAIFAVIFVELNF